MNADARGVPANAELRMKFRLLILLGAVLFLSCDDGVGKNDLHPNYREPMVWGLLSKDFTFQELTYDKAISVVDYDGFRMEPIVLLNGSQVDLLGFTPFEYDYGDTNVIPAYQKYELEVRHFWGVGFCHVVMPGDFALRAPSDTHILARGESLASAWRVSRGAQWYWLSVNVSYDYYDSLGDWGYFELSLDTLVNDTSIVMSPERIFPPVVGQVIDGDGSVTVEAGYGPANDPDGNIANPGDIGNVRGCAVGFVSAVNVPPEKYFYVGAPPANRRAPDGHVQFERFKARLRGRIPRS